MTSTRVHDELLAIAEHDHEAPRANERAPTLDDQLQHMLQCDLSADRRRDITSCLKATGGLLRLLPAPLARLIEENLRAIITELRPAALDELGLKIALEALLDRHREQSGLQIAGELALPDPATGAAELDRDLESAVYRLVQESLTNVVKHAEASSVRIAVGASDGALRVQIQDDGKGFDPEATGQGFGLEGMHERVSLAGGTLDISPSEHGTLVQACLPIDAGGEPAERTAARH